MRLAQLDVNSGVVGVKKHRDDGRVRDQLVQKSHSLGLKLASEKAHASDIAARTIEAGYKPKLDRVAADSEDNWQRANCRLNGQRRRVSNRNEYCCPLNNQITRQCWQAIVLSVRPALLQSYILSFNESEF